jgi:predicted nucleotidyltransferase
VAAFAARKFRLEAVILMGSAARRQVSEDFARSPSDIDLLLVCGSERDADAVKSAVVEYVASSVFEEYGVNCYPITVTSASYRRRLKERDAFITDAHTEGVVLHGKKPERAG